MAGQPFPFSSTGASEMRGRDELMALAERRLDSVQSGSGHLMLLSGEAGIGKTRLLHAVRQRAEVRGFVPWSAAAFPQDVEMSAGLLLDLGHSMSRSDRPRLSQIGCTLVGELVGGNPASDVSGDAHRRRRFLVLDAVNAIGSLAADSPAFLALEDLHWCDELSLEVVAHLARGLGSLRLLVVGTVRTDELHSSAPVRAWRSRLLLQRLAEEVLLDRLSLQQTRAMVAELLPGQRPPSRLDRLVHQRSGGVPLYVEELVKSAAHGHLSADPSYVPETLSEAIRQRFAALTVPAQDVGVAAAVVRRSFDLELLTAVAGCSDKHAATYVDELVDRQFVREEPRGWFAFRHALIREAIERQAPLARRRELHARLADVARLRVDLGGDAYRSAHHEEAGQFAEASVAAAVAAERASAMSAHQEALDLLHRAVRCLRDDNDDVLVDLLTRRAVEAAATDHNAQAAADYERAHAILLSHGDRRAAAAVLPGLVATRHLLGDPLAARVDLLDEALRDVEADPDDADGEVPRRLEADLLAAKAAAYLVDDRLDDAVASGERAWALVGAQEERTRLDTAATLGCAFVFSGRMEEGWDRLEQTTLQARSRGLEAEAARGYRMIGSSASTLVEYERAEHWLREGIEYAARTEQWNHRHYMASHQAHVWWCTGRWDDAEQSSRRALTEAEGGITTRIIALHVDGFVSLGQGRMEEAFAVLEEARALGEEMGELQRFSPALWGLAECALLRGEHGQAVNLSEAGYQASHRVADAANLYPYLVTGVRARLAAHNPAAAQEWTDRVADDLARRGIPGTLPAVDHAVGLLHLAAGRTGKARDRLTAAYTAWTTRSRWWEGQWCAWDLASCALASNRRTEAAALVEQVRAAASVVAAKPLLDACAGLEARLEYDDTPQPWSPLTLREFEVARLVARGLTNKEIAQALRITTRTAGSHLEHISTKLGTSRRSEIASWVTSLQA